MVKAMKQLLVLASILLAFLSGCGGSTASVEKVTILPVPPIVTLPQESVVISGQPLHNASGIPTGIRVSWFGVDDLADGGSRIEGYHIYKSDNPIPDDALGDTSFWVDIGGEFLVDQAIIPGSEIVVEDLFPVTDGEVWYYRITSVASDGDESALSPEVAVTIAAFYFDGQITTSAGVDAPVEIRGNNFGVLDPVNDKVEIPGVDFDRLPPAISMMENERETYRRARALGRRLGEKADNLLS